MRSVTGMMTGEKQRVTTGRLAFGAVVAYLWVMMILLGSIVLETFMVYPNIFHDPPQSLATAMEFMSVRGPNDFFPPLGLFSWVTGLASLALAWRVPSARYWILGSLLMIVGEGLASIAFFWPRNEILFVEGQAVHSAAYLRRIAEEFTTLHWLRLAFNVGASSFAFVAMLRLHRRTVDRSGTGNQRSERREYAVM